MKADIVPKRSAGVFIEEIEGENLIYRLGTHQAIHLNETATVIFKLCDGSRSVQQVIDLLAAEYPIAEADVTTDVLDAVDLLVREGVLDTTSVD